MKRFLFCIAAAIILMIPLCALADYATYYDVFNDVKLLLGDDPDAAWSMTFETAKSIADGWEGFSCREAGDSLVCDKISLDRRIPSNIFLCRRPSFSL